MSSGLLSFQPDIGEITACGASIFVHERTPRFDPAQWSLKEMERGFSRRVRENEFGSAVLYCADGWAVGLYVSVGMPGDDLGWDGWSEDQERARQTANDAAMMVAFGSLKADFDWGGAISSFDARTGSASIGIRFSRRSRWRDLFERTLRTLGIAVYQRTPTAKAQPKSETEID